MEDRCGYSRQGSGVWRSLRDGDFEEEDVWAVLKEGKDSNTIKLGQSIEESSSSVVTVRRHLPSAARMIPRTFSVVNTSCSSNNIGSSSSSSSHEANGGVKQQQSAPVNIPDWSKFSRKNKSKKGLSWHDDDDDDYDDDDDHDSGAEEEEGFDSKLPPHEFLAKRLARSQISSFSVFEGVGRKLKGRDLRKVRNAVLTRTGFLE
ncbi:disease resistance protein RPM1-like isoform X1 [Hibiscus syriacus]|uniref:Disease resistance protein RPM1-like isoform X1 n=1 Tax=Hibiscus syriacus TaxID=106335 RepID=A0A6A2X785_HIBSY|nr:uncharacterized protein LOC120197935 [Hibiscus syriacus]XP_039055265.1 uncharacterized protein LOC120197935 [Hibiscus syriacus]XP_039055266.1 uncharacterized protein LOC120197935 [Hibiscus syriacus]KAE8654229.1 disease resistance protein RPM1-like isoform X1 [Hibiscus syriacus]